MTPLLETIDVKKQFKIPGQRPIAVLKGVHLTVAPGEKVAIVGRSGAGKSTLLNILGGLEKPTSGRVERPKNIGFVFQRYHLMPELTVLENVLLPTRAAGRAVPDAAARATELLTRVGLAGRLHHLPAELSGGEMQRVALARALVTAPELILADEPTGNLDALTGAEILKILSWTEVKVRGEEKVKVRGEGEQRNVYPSTVHLSSSPSPSLILVTHSPEAAAICDRVLTLEDGVLK